jgi:hypothetical protein
MTTTKDEQDALVRRWAVLGRVPALRAPRVDPAEYYELVTALARRYAYLEAWACLRPHEPFAPVLNQVALESQLAELAAWASRRRTNPFVLSKQPMGGALPRELAALIGVLEVWASQRATDPLALYLGEWRHVETKSAKDSRAAPPTAPTEE